MTDKVMHTEAVEAAVDALVDSRLGDHKGINGEELVEAASAALEAAAPYIQAEAWESGYTLGYADCANKQESNRPNPHGEKP